MIFFADNDGRLEKKSYFCRNLFEKMKEINTEQLRQRFNPDGSQLRRQQLRMLDMLLVLDDICQRHHIRYWLSSGTLIGALRHDGRLNDITALYGSSRKIPVSFPDMDGFPLCLCSGKIYRCQADAG